MSKYSADALAQMAHQLRSGSRRASDPDVLTTSRLETIRDQNLKLAAALGSDAARRQPATPSRAEAAEISRITSAHKEWFGGADNTQGTGR